MSGDETAGSKSARALAVLVFAAALALSVAIGFFGAPRGERFDWQLCAEIGTALGTILLAAYTARLASITRREVSLGIQQEAARDRPTVVVSRTGIGSVVLDPVSGQSVPTLLVVMRNVGLGPALDLHLKAHHGEYGTAPEVVPVVAVGEVVDRAISLSGIPEPSGGFVPRDLKILGDFEDRTRRTRHDVTVLSDEGLVDEVAAARDIASRRAWFDLIPGRAAAVTHRRDDVVQYEPVIQNRGPAPAERVVVELVTFDDRTQVGVSEPIELMEPQTETKIVLRLPAPQPALTCRISWRDAIGARERVFESVYPALGR